MECGWRAGCPNDWGAQSPFELPAGPLYFSGHVEPALEGLRLVELGFSLRQRISSESNGLRILMIGR